MNYNYNQEDPDYGEYDDEEMKSSYLLGFIVLVISSIVLWTIIISVLCFLF